MTYQLDLHLHTTASDGQLSPTEVVCKALALGLTAIAITDHDTTEGVQEALSAAQNTGLEVIPGVEISTDLPQNEVHILGYYVDPHGEALGQQLRRFRESRLNRAQRMVTKLARMGVSLEWNRVQQIANGAAVGRPHIARAMLEKGYASSLSDAFDRYIGRNGPAYVERFKLSPAEAVQLILAAGGLPVIAHPLQVSHMIPELVTHGLLGVEAYYTGYQPDEILYLRELAFKHGLITTGGSDFHGEENWPRNKMGAIMIPEDVLTNLHTLQERRGSPARQFLR